MHPLATLRRLRSRFRVSRQPLGQQRPWTLIEADDPALSLAEGDMSDYPTLDDAARAFALSPAACKRLVFDDDHTARELNAREQKRLELVCWIHGLEVLDVA